MLNQVASWFSGDNNINLTHTCDFYKYFLLKIPQYKNGAGYKFAAEFKLIITFSSTCMFKNFVKNYLDCSSRLNRSKNNQNAMKY